MYGYLYRHLLLPAFDLLKGRQTLRYWSEFEQTQWQTPEQLAASQLTALQALLAHAFQTCPWYQDHWRSLGLSPQTVQSFKDFEAWPVLTRDQILSHRPRLRTALPLPLIAKSTGGSSGQPLHFDLNTDSNDRRTALMYRGYNWAHAAPGTKQLYIWGGALSGTPLWKQWKLAAHAAFERKCVINCFEFTPPRMLEHVATLNAYRPDTIIAYTTPLYEFARYLDEHQVRPFSPKSIVVGAEKLHGFQRELIERVFGCPVFETYGSREFMLIGSECERHNGLHLSQENLYVEILDDAGRPTPVGQEGNVVITDLFNYGLPFVRYVNGDRAVAGWKSCPCGRGLPLMSKVTGRRLDTLVTVDGRKIPGEFFPHLLKDYASVRRFQVVQSVSDSITIKLVAPDFSHDERESLLSAIRVCTGWDVHLDLQLVDDIPLTKAGKLKVVVNELACLDTPRCEHNEIEQQLPQRQ